MEPLWWVDECEPFACGVTSELFDEGHGGGDVACLVAFDGDAVNDDLCVAFLWNYACSSGEGGGEDGPVPVYLVIGRLACEGQDEVVGEA